MPSSACIHCQGTGLQYSHNGVLIRPRRPCHYCEGSCKMTPYYQENGIAIYCGDAREILPAIDPVDHCITDPPYFGDVYLRMDGLSDGHIGSLKRNGPALRRMAAGEIGHVDKLVEPASKELARLVKQWALVF